MEENLDKQEINKPLRDEKGRLLPGNTANPHGRPKGQTLKEFQAELFRSMTPEQKIQWLEEHKIGGIDRWRMAEGNPKQDVEAEVKGEITISISEDIANKYAIKPNDTNSSSENNS